MKAPKFNLFIFVACLLIAGCFGKSSQVMNSPSDKIQVKMIAVLPVESKNDAVKTAKLLRARLMEELYFKGYSKLSPEIIDSKLDSLYVKDVKGNNKNSSVDPQALKEALGADAGLYCTSAEESGSKIFYTPLKITLNCELRSAQTGETLWKGKAESARGNFVLTKKDYDKNEHDDFEIVIDEVVSKILKTLPDGPNLRG